MSKHIKLDNYETNLMSLPQELLQKVIFFMDPFDMYRLYIASLGSFKQFCDDFGWLLKIKKDFPNVNNYSYSHLNLIWVYFSLFFSELKYVEYQKQLEDGEGLFVFIHFIKLIEGMPHIQISYEFNTDEQIELHFNKFHIHQNDKVWEYFKNVSKFMSYSVSSYDEGDIFLYINRSKSDNMFRAFYLLFELGFKLLDCKLQEDGDIEYYVE